MMLENSYESESVDSDECERLLERFLLQVGELFLIVLLVAPF